MPFKVTLPGDGGTFVTDDLTVGEAEWIEQQTGGTWLTLNPVRSAGDWRAVVAAYLMRGMDEDAAVKQARSYALRDVTGGIELVDDDRPTEHEDGIPKAAGGGSTSGSSGRGKRSGGRRT